ncbi:MAG TPA: S41 family peptidase [Lacipirellulaceae bacterium]|nr:S41 family peptidase [Lacipirellulaceae bacterium]
MSRRNLLLLLLAIAFSYACYLRGEQNPYARYAAEGLATIHRDSLDALPSSELFDGAMRGMVDVLHQHGDEHSQYFDEAEANPLRSEIHQQFGGIGVRIGLVGAQHRLAIVAPPEPGSPAASANIEAGDFIIKIDDRSTGGMKINDASRLLRGEPGTIVRLSLEHPPDLQPRMVQLKRGVINAESVIGDRRDSNGNWQFRLGEDPRIAQVRITSFGDHTAAEFEHVIRKLIHDGVRAIVLDLRENPGGSLDAAVAVCKTLLPAGKTIVETRGRGQVLLHRYASTSNGPFVDLPMAVVVNQYSASAAEIVAACLQDNGRAVVVGQRSYGKGTVQQLLPLESGKSLLKLTWASFWRPSGMNIQRTPGALDNAIWGVMPDSGFEYKLSPQEYKAYQTYREKRDGISQIEAATGSEAYALSKSTSFVDTQLQLAVKYLSGKPGDNP